jgi:E3 ubiquitin-protein ligase MYLIP
VCEVLGIVERDYFGLKYHSSQGGRSWLNLRNSIKLQLGQQAREPYVFDLRVKFFVNPSQVLQDKTKSQFFHNLKRQLRDGKFRFSDRMQLAQAVALASQAEYGFGYNPERPSYRSYCMEGEWNEELEAAIALQHIRASQHTRQEAMKEFLKVFADHPDYGMQTHLLDPTRNDDRIAVGVSMKAIDVFNRSGQRNSGPMLHRVNDVRCCGKQLTLTSRAYGETSPRKETFYLPSQEAATTLERAITEYHTFYHRATVDLRESPRFTNPVDAICCKLSSHWRRHRRVYRYDVTRTCREAFFLSWDRLQKQRQEEAYADTSDPANYYHFVDDSPQMEEDIIYSDTDSAYMFDISTTRQSTDSLNSDRSDMETTKDSASLPIASIDFECRICMDSAIDTVFCPCGHAVCCKSCSQRVKSCPICRGTIHLRQQLFLPTIPTM